jgi:hypothetical protein
LVTSFLHVDGAVRSFTTNTLATQGVFTNVIDYSLSNQSFCPRYPPSEVMTILQSLSFILAATADAENQRKQQNVWSIRAQAKVAIASSGIIGK